MMDCSFFVSSILHLSSILPPRDLLLLYILFLFSYLPSFNNSGLAIVNGGAPVLLMP